MRINAASPHIYSSGMGSRPGQDSPGLNPAAVSMPPGPPPPGIQADSPPHALERQGDPKEEAAAHSSEQAEKQAEEQESPAPDRQFTQAELQLLAQLKQVDTEVRNHEMAHVAAGGGLITSGASFSYKRGPDGKNYAVAGEVGIDTAPVPGDPQATLQKMQQVKSAALAPANPSSQDIKVASQATALASKALGELTLVRAEEMAAARETRAFGNLKQASDIYTRVNSLPEYENTPFHLAV